MQEVTSSTPYTFNYEADEAMRNRILAVEDSVDDLQSMRDEMAAGKQRADELAAARERARELNASAEKSSPSE